MCYIKSSLIRQRGRISNWVLQKNKALQIFRKTNISYPLIRTRMCAYQGNRNVFFFGKFTVLCFAYFVHFAHRHLTFNRVFNFPTLRWNAIAGWVKVLRDLMSRWLANSNFLFSQLNLSSNLYSGLLETLPKCVSCGWV